MTSLGAGTRRVGVLNDVVREQQYISGRCSAWYPDPAPAIFAIAKVIRSSWLRYADRLKAAYKLPISPHVRAVSASGSLPCRSSPTSTSRSGSARSNAPASVAIFEADNFAPCALQSPISISQIFQDFRIRTQAARWLPATITARLGVVQHPKRSASIFHIVHRQFQHATDRAHAVGDTASPQVPDPVRRRGWPDFFIFSRIGHLPTRICAITKSHVA